MFKKKLIKLFKYILRKLCIFHRYKLIVYSPVHWGDDESSGTHSARGLIQCEHCKRVKKFTVKECATHNFLQIETNYYLLKHNINFKDYMDELFSDGVYVFD